MGKGSVLGTPDYIAPEQALHKADRQSDVYSLGATLYAMLLGEPPFPVPIASQKLMAHQMREVTPPHKKDRRVPPELSLLVVRMMVKQPQDRPGLGEVIEALRPFAAAPEAAPAPAAPAAGGRLWLWVGVAVAVALCVGLAVWAALAGAK
jgi:serine/threonine-protein kinase